MSQCSICNNEFSYHEKEKEVYKKLGYPLPNECNICRWKNLMAFWPSIGKWYKRKCDFSGETILTNFSHHARFPVFKKKYFDGDEWTPESMERDPNKGIFDQLKEL